MGQKIISLILNILLVIVTIVLAIGCYYIYQIQILKNEYANLFGYTFFEVATASMYPTIEVGDVVIVEITKNVEENDIIVYIDEESIITHRLIEKNDDKLIARGDANNSADMPIDESMLLGKVVKIVPKLGIWRKILISPEVAGLIITLLVLFGFGYAYFSKPEEKDEK